MKAQLTEFKNCCVAVYVNCNLYIKRINKKMYINIQINHKGFVVSSKIMKTLLRTAKEIIPTLTVIVFNNRFQIPQ